MPTNCQSESIRRSLLADDPLIGNARPGAQINFLDFGRLRHAGCGFGENRQDIIEPEKEEDNNG